MNPPANMDRLSYYEQFFHVNKPSSFYARIIGGDMDNVLLIRKGLMVTDADLANICQFAKAGHNIRLTRENGHDDDKPILSHNPLPSDVTQALDSMRPVNEGTITDICDFIKDRAKGKSPEIVDGEIRYPDEIGDIVDVLVEEFRRELDVDTKYSSTDPRYNFFARSIGINRDIWRAVVERGKQTQQVALADMIDIATAKDCDPTAMMVKVYEKMFTRMLIEPKSWPLPLGVGMGNLAYQGFSTGRHSLEVAKQLITYSMFVNGVSYLQDGDLFLDPSWSAGVGLLHDIGKLQMEDTFNFPGELPKETRSERKKHPIWSAKILMGIKGFREAYKQGSGFARAVYNAATSHHYTVPKGGYQVQNGLLTRPHGGYPTDELTNSKFLGEELKDAIEYFPKNYARLPMDNYSAALCVVDKVAAALFRDVGRRSSRRTLAPDSLFEEIKMECYEDPSDFDRLPRLLQTQSITDPVHNAMVASMIMYGSVLAGRHMKEFLQRNIIDYNRLHGAA